jgi:hypothetical protein
MKKSWKTTTAGAITALIPLAQCVAAVLDNDPATVPSWELAIVGLGAFAVALFARDNGVTSEQAGAK